MRSPAWRSAFLLVLAFLLPESLSHPAAAAEKPQAAPPSGLPGTLEEPAELKQLKFRLLGPAWGGRVARVAGVPGNPAIYYAATASGGVWKSVDGGQRWQPVFDDQPISSIGSIAVAASDPNA